MSGHVCSIVPPHLLFAMAESQDDAIRQLGVNSLAMSKQIHEGRHAYFKEKLAHSHHGGTGGQQGIVPNILLEHLSKADGVDESVKQSAQKSLAMGMLTCLPNPSRKTWRLRIP